MDTSGQSADAQQFLTIYLRDHRGGAAAGLRLARRCRDRASDQELQAAMSAVAEAIAADSRTLDSLMDALGVAPSRFKIAIGGAAELLGRLKTNGRVWHRTALGEVLELEALGAGIHAKRDLWRSLSAVADRSAALDQGHLAELIAGATDQLERVRGQHDRLAGRTF